MGHWLALHLGTGQGRGSLPSCTPEVDEPSECPFLLRTLLGPLRLCLHPHRQDLSQHHLPTKLVQPSTKCGCRGRGECWACPWPCPCCPEALLSQGISHSSPATV